METNVVIPEHNDPDFGLKVKQLREQLGLSRPEFAHKLGMGNSTLFVWEEKNNQPTPGAPPRPPSKRLYNRLTAFVKYGTTFEKKKYGNAATGRKDRHYVPPAPPPVVDLTRVKEADILRELKRRGYKVTLEM